MPPRYRAAWRWHFLAGVFVVPFLLVLATTGLVMLYYTAIETPLGERLSVAGDGPRRAPSEQLAAAQAALPGAEALQYIAAPAPAAPVQFELGRDGGTFVVDVNPYTNAVLRVVDKEGTAYALAHRIHGTLLLGDGGDLLLEIAAGLALLLIFTGPYMWWQQRGAGERRGSGRREGWRRWHLYSGLFAALGLGFFLLSGMAWTSLWGGELVQAWGSFPAQKWGPLPLSAETHSAMNHGGAREVPWGLEQTPLPAAGPAAAHAGHAGGAAVDLDRVDAIARTIGFGPRYRINLPRGVEGVYTISSTSMAGDLDRPSDERTVHVDPNSGEILAEVGFADYSLLARSMAVGVAVHQGSLGWWTSLLDLLICLLVIFLCISGTVLWWLRRPARSGWLPRPPRSAELAWRNSLTVLLVVLGLAFPLLGVCLLAVYTGNRLLLLRQ